MIALDDIAEGIRAHLNRFASNPDTSHRIWIDGRGKEWRTTLYYMPMAWRAGSRVKLKYVTYQYESSLTKAEATAYLAWLNAGNIGRHHNALRKAEDDAG